MQPADGGGGGGGGGAVVPQFLSKIWALVEDPQTNEFICWSADGQSFKVLDEESFAKKILPKHFKHNNMASFVRQLNSYGFHKVMQYESGSAKQERCGSGKYQHPFFRKGQEELLSKIKRKVSLPRIENDKIDPEELHKMLAIIHQMQGKQDMIDSTLESLKRIHPSNADWVLEHRNRSCENQEHLEYEQATDNSGLDTEADDYSCTFSDSGHIKKRRKMNHFAVQKTEQHLHQMHNDSIKLTERVLALEEKSFRKLSEISSTLSTLASFIMNAEKSQRLSQV